jgi:hypothetical protein
VAVPADYDGGKTDIAIWRPSSVRSGSARAVTAASSPDDGARRATTRARWATMTATATLRRVSPRHPSAAGAPHRTTFYSGSDRPATSRRRLRRRRQERLRGGARPGCGDRLPSQSTAGFFAAPWGLISDRTSPATTTATARPTWRRAADGGRVTTTCGRARMGRDGQVGFVRDLLAPGDGDGDGKPISLSGEVALVEALRCSSNHALVQPWGLGDIRWRPSSCDSGTSDASPRPSRNIAT